jgi:UDP-glucuronate 4-epimerase
VATPHKILITGATSQVGLPVARGLARGREVWALGRFARAEERERLSRLGIRCLSLDLADGSFDGLPDDFDAVLHFAVSKTGDFARDLEVNAEGTGRLMAHCRRARSFLHCSSAGVYQHRGAAHPARETDPLGDNHRGLLPTYSLSKIAAESVARFAAREFGLPTVIARLSVPFGDNGGWPWFHLALMRAGRPVPLHPERPNLFNPIHEDDICAQVPRLLEIASVPATVVNWGGSEPASIEDWTAWLTALTGLEAKLEPSERALGSLELDLGRMHAALGRTRVSWRDGIRRMLEARSPELLKR